MQREDNGNRQDLSNLNFGRRALMKSTLLGGGAAAAGALFGGLIPAAALAVDDSAKFETPVVATNAGKVRGVIQAGHAYLSRNSLRCLDRREQPLYASSQTRTVVRGARCFREWADRAAVGWPAKSSHSES